MLHFYIWYPREVTLLRLCVISTVLYFLTKGAKTFGAISWTRTSNTRIFSPLLYHWSYYGLRLSFQSVNNTTVTPVFLRTLLQYDSSLITRPPVEGGVISTHQFAILKHTKPALFQSGLSAIMQPTGSP